MNQHAQPLPRPATYQDVLDAPPHKVAEIASGRLWLHPRPAMGHGRAAFKLGARLDDPFENGLGGPGGWYFAVEPELHLDADILVPDLAGWRRERLGDFPTAAPYVRTAPDWVCEILSPSTRRFDIGEKRGLYAARGVTHLWQLDPEACTLEAFEKQGRHWTLLATITGEAEVSLPPFDAIGFPLSALWPG